MASPLLPEVAVNGETIPAAAIAAEAQLHPAPPGKPGLAWRAAARQARPGLPGGAGWSCASAAIAAAGITSPLTTTAG